MSRLSILVPLNTWGGIERKILILCREFLALGVQPELILTRGGKVPYPDEFPPEVEIINLQSGGKLDAVPRLIRHLRQSDSRALLTAKDHANKVGVLARRFGRLDLPVFLKVTNTLSQTLRRPAKRYTARWLYPWADKVVAISQGVKNDLVDEFGMNPSQIQVIYNPMFTPDFPERISAPVEHPWFSPGQLPVFLGAGRLTVQKDFPTLVKAFALVRSDRPCRLVILGEGVEREAILKCAAELGVADDVDLPGFVPDPIPWMARAAGFVLSSRFEGLGNVLVEAMATGTPVVATDCPSGPAEILEKGRYGSLSAVGDVKGLAAGMLSVLCSPPDRSLLIFGAERFRSRRIAEEYLALMGIESQQ